MRPMLSLLLALVFWPGGFMPSASAQDSTVYVVTYVEVAAASTGPGMSALEQQAAASRKDDGNLLVRVLRETGKENRFVILEAWKDQKSFEAHGKADHTLRFREQLAPIQNSPPDERVHNALWIGPAKPAQPSGLFYVVTHVDVPPPRKDDVIVLLKQLGEDSAKEPDNLKLDVVQQTNRPNHFSVVEIWTDRKALDGHDMAAHTRQFRDKLAPMLGAPHDDRIYRPID